MTLGSLRLGDLHPIYLEALCVWEAFRRLGFSAEEIYVGLHPPERSFVVALPARNYGFVVRPIGSSHLALAASPIEEVMAGWKEAALLWNELSARKDPEIETVWQESNVRRHTALFVTELMRNDIPIPHAADC